MSEEDSEKQAEIDATVELLKDGDGEKSPEEVFETLGKSSKKAKSKVGESASAVSVVQNGSTKNGVMGLSLLACTLIGVFFIQKYVTPTYVSEKDPGVGLLMKEIVDIKPRMDNMINSLEQIESGLIAEGADESVPYLKVKMLSVETNIRALKSDLNGLSASLEVLKEDHEIQYGVLSQTSEEIKTKIDDLGTAFTEPEAGLDPIDMNENKGYRYKWKRDKKSNN